MKSLYEDRKYRINEYIQSKDYHPMKIKQMALMLNVPSDEREDFRDIIKELQKPGRDPRDEMPKPVLRSDVLKIEDLKEDMILTTGI